MAFFLKQDWDGMAKLYSDTVKFYDPSTPKPYGLTDAKKDGWMFTMAGNKSALPSKAILMGYNMTKIHSRYNHGGQ
jgi:hypothetical protein